MDKEACICVITARKAQDKDHKGMSIHVAQEQELGDLVSICVITRSMAQDKEHKGMGISGAQIQDLDSLAESISSYESTVPDQTEKSLPLIDETVKANFSTETLSSQARETFSSESN